MIKTALDHPIFEIVSHCAAEMGVDVYVVGGYVRDIYLDRVSKDVDFVTVGSGIALAKAVKQKMDKAYLSVFKNFGTAQIKTEDWEFEFVGARRESYDRNSRKPAVEDGSFEEDISRRDFTINSMAISLQEANFGELIDLYNGLQDLDDGILRTPLDPNTTFDDDPLRMMRAVRFACQLNMQIEPGVRKAIKAHAERLSIVSQERITDELQKIMAADRPSIGLKLLFETGLLAQFFPELCAMQGIEVRDGQGHKDNFYHTLKVVDKVAAKSQHIWLRWGALLHDIGKPRTKRFYKEEGWTFHGHEDRGGRMVKGIFKRLKLPLNDRMRFVTDMVRLHHRPIALTHENISDSAIRRLIFDAGEDLDELLTLCRCDITTKNKEKEKRFLANLDMVEAKVHEVEERDRIRNWQPPIDGNEIMRIFGIGAGKEIGTIKNALKDAILDGEIKNNYDEAFRFVVEQGEQLGLKATKDE